MKENRGQNIHKGAMADKLDRKLTTQGNRKRIMQRWEVFSLSIT
jgi:hypothetical protein